MNLNQISSLGYADLKYPRNLRLRVEDAMKSWMAFCALPDEEKEKMMLGTRQRDIGYVRRRDEGPKADKKEFFHTVGKRKGLLAQHAELINDPRAIAFLHANDVLVEAIKPLVAEFARKVEQEWRVVDFEKTVLASVLQWTFRYLHYFPGAVEAGEPIANAHTDRGGVTMHLFETHPGARYLGLKDRTWHPLPVGEGETVIFPSMGLQLESHGRLKALCHDVIATPEAAKEGRYSMVAFIDFGDDKYNDHNKRLQEFEPGFNYDMPLVDFRQLFVKRTEELETI